MRKCFKSIVACSVATAMLAGIVATDTTEAAKKIKLSKTKITMEADSTYKLKVKNGKKAAKVT